MELPVHPHREKRCKPQQRLSRKSAGKTAGLNQNHAPGLWISTGALPVPEGVCRGAGGAAVSSAPGRPSSPGSAARGRRGALPSCWQRHRARVHRHPSKHDDFDLRLHPQDGARHHKIRRIVLARLRQLAGQEDRARDRLAVGTSGSASALRGFPEHSTFLLHPAPVPLPLPVAAGKSFSISGHRAPGGRQYPDITLSMDSVLLNWRLLPVS